VKVDALEVHVVDDERALGQCAADRALGVLRAAIEQQGQARVMFASGNSQLAFFDALAEAAGTDFSKVVGFHMDEYIGMAADHPASFARYMRERVVERLHPRSFHVLRGDAPDAAEEATRYAALLRDQPLDLCCLGIGENGHLAFNDPPVADFDDPLDVKVVRLDDACRRQQVGEGHFPAFADVPTHAITVTVPALLRARTVLAIVPEERKAEAVRRTLEGPIAAACPASALRDCPHATLYLDRHSASLLTPR
jgi:glucosamine-6-phosphate deaminase